MRANDSWEKVVNASISLGAILVVFGLLSLTGAKHQGVIESKTGLTARDAAVESAKRNGRQDYQFQSNFIPGLGVIDNPEQYKQDWQNSLPKK